MRLVPAPRGREQVPYPLIFGAITLLVAAAAWLRVSLTTGWLPPLCPLRVLTGIPCPACRATRALAALLSGHPGAALGLNPLAALVALGCIGAALVSAARRLAGGSPLSLQLGRRESALLRLGAVAALSANWIYLVATR